MIEAQTTTDEPQVFEWRLDPKDAKTSIFLKEKCVEFAPIKQVYGFIKSNMGTSQTNTRRQECFIQSIHSQSISGVELHLSVIIPYVSFIDPLAILCARRHMLIWILRMLPPVL